jgi:hypothetical protein
MTTIENLSCLKGKTIESVTAVLNDGGNAKSFILYLSDGQEIEVFTNIVHHGNEEHAAESEIIVDDKF